MEFYHSIADNKLLATFVSNKPSLDFEGSSLISEVRESYGDYLICLMFSPDYILDRSIINCFDKQSGRALWTTDISQAGAFNAKASTASQTATETGKAVSFLGIIEDEILLVQIAPIRMLYLSIKTGQILGISDNAVDFIPTGLSYIRRCLRHDQAVFYFSLHDVYRFDCEKKTWQQVVSFENNNVRWQFENVFVHGGEFYFIGRSDFGTMPDTVGIFDPVSRNVTWSIRLAEINSKATYLHDTIYFSDSSFYVLDSEKVLHAFRMK